jgi:hypothetical protein
MRLALTWVLVGCCLAGSGCQSAVHRVKIPLGDEVSVAAPGAVARISIEDLRPVADRRPRRGKQIMSCEHWFGDDSFIPSRVSYLQARVAQRTRDDMRIHIRLLRFDVVEYCEFVRGGDSTGAAKTSSGSMGFTPAPVNGDTVIMRLAGEVDGVPFDQSSRFDYGTMYSFPDPPSSSPAYRAQLRARLDLLIDDIVNKVWAAELVRKGLASK